MSNNSDVSSDQSSSGEEIVEHSFECKLCPNSKFTREEIDDHRNRHVQAGEWPPRRQRSSSRAPSTLIRPFPPSEHGDNNQGDEIPTRNLRPRTKMPKPNETRVGKVSEKNKGGKGKGRKVRREREKIKTVKQFNKDVGHRRFHTG